MSQLAAVILLSALAGALLGALGLYAAAFSLRKKSEAEAAQQREDLKGQFASVSADVFRAATDQFLTLAQTRLETERTRAAGELDEKRRAVESAVGQLTEKLKGYEELVRSFESDRAKKYGSLEEQLRATTQATGELRATAEGLRAALSNSQVRGQWGERMAEDILRAAGFAENVQYLKNKAQDTSNTRPDFTFLLPDGHKLHMDVKFPLENYLRMVNAPSEDEAARLKGEFLRNVKECLKTLQKRQYVNPEEKTLNYVLLFIPNERIYGFILEAMPGIVDEALAQKVVLTSPFSLYAILAVLRQGFENFHFSQEMQGILKKISGFRQDYEIFQGRFLKLGEQLEKVSGAYQEVAQTSYKRLDQAMARIEGLRQGTPEAGENKNPIPKGDGVPS